jgi:hypothetical protein
MILFSPAAIYTWAILLSAFILYSLYLVYRLERAHFNKLVWVLVIILIPVLGSLIYCLKCLITPAASVDKA